MARPAISGTRLMAAMAFVFAVPASPPAILMAALMVFCIVIGMFLDGISAVVRTMAVVEPMVRMAAFADLGFDMIWFGIFVVVVVEMAQITPLVGFNLFVLQGMTSHEMGYISRTALAMFLIMVLMVGVLVLFPELATWLPETLGARSS